MPASEFRRNYLGVDPESNASAGGSTIVMRATVALKIGDVVYANTVAGEVTKGTVIATIGNTFVGIVVGGGDTFGGGPALFGTSEVGLALIPAGKSVTVQVNGIANVVAGAAIAAGALVTGDTATAGRVITGVITSPTAPSAAYVQAEAQSMKTAVDAARNFVGVALKAAAAAGDVIQVLITRK